MAAQSRMSPSVIRSAIAAKGSAGIVVKMFSLIVIVGSTSHTYNAVAPHLEPSRRPVLALGEIPPRTMREREKPFAIFIRMLAKSKFGRGLNRLWALTKRPSIAPNLAHFGSGGLV